MELEHHQPPQPAPQPAPQPVDQPTPQPTESGLFTHLTLEQIGDLCFGIFLYTKEASAAATFSTMYHVHRKWIRFSEWDRFATEEPCKHVGHEHKSCIARFHITPHRTNIVEEPRENRLDFWTKIHADLVHLKNYYTIHRPSPMILFTGFVDCTDVYAVIAISEAEKAVSVHIANISNAAVVVAPEPSNPPFPHHFQDELSEIAAKMGWECVVCAEALTGDRFGLTPCFHKVCSVCIYALDRCPICRRVLGQ